MVSVFLYCLSIINCQTDSRKSMSAELRTLNMELCVHFVHYALFISLHAAVICANMTCETIYIEQPVGLSNLKLSYQKAKKSRLYLSLSKVFIDLSYCSASSRLSHSQPDSHTLNFIGSDIYRSPLLDSMSSTSIQNSSFLI